MTIKKITERNKIGYNLDDKDIKGLVYCLSKENKGQLNSHNQFIDRAIIETMNIEQQFDIISEFNAELTSKSDCKSVKKYYIPLNLENYHWNIVEIVQKSQSVTCRQLETDGSARPVDDAVMRQIQKKFTAKGYQKSEICNSNKTEQMYTFLGQRENNCGIICAHMALDGLCDRLDSNNTLQTYGGKITKNMNADEIRNTASETINRHGTENIKKDFCRTKEEMPTNLPGGGIHFRYQEDLPHQKTLHDCLFALRPEDLKVLYDIISDQEISIKEKNQRLRKLDEEKPDKRFSFLFKEEDQNKNMVEDHDNMIHYVYENKKPTEKNKVTQENQKIKAVNLGNWLQGIILSMTAFLSFNTTIALICTATILIVLSICILTNISIKEKEEQAVVTKEEQAGVTEDKKMADDFDNMIRYVYENKKSVVQGVESPAENRKIFEDHIKSEFFNKKSVKIGICVAITGFVAAATYHRDQIVETCCTSINEMIRNTIFCP